MSTKGQTKKSTDTMTVSGISADNFKVIGTLQKSSVGLNVPCECTIEIGEERKFDFETYLTANKDKPSKKQWGESMRTEFPTLSTVPIRFLMKGNEVSKTSVFLPNVKSLSLAVKGCIEVVEKIVVINNNDFRYGMTNGILTSERVTEKK